MACKKEFDALLNKHKVGVEVSGDEFRLEKMNGEQFSAVEGFVDAHDKHITTGLYQSEAGKLLVTFG